MKLLIVIVNYRVTHLTIDCLHSVADQIGSVPGAQVIVCENGTGDDSAEKLQRAIDENAWEKWCKLFPIATNLGFTGGNNVILREALQASRSPQYCLLLNADTIVRPNAFKALVDFMDENPGVGIAGSRLEDPDSTPQRSAFRFQSPLSEFEAHFKLGLVTKVLSRWVVAPPVVDQIFETDWVSGASMIVRREVFRDVGLLDEPTFYVPTSRVVHLVGQSTGVTTRPKRLPPYLFEARRRYFLKNHGPIYAAMADAGCIIGLALWRLRVMVTGKEDFTAPCLLRDSIRHSVFNTGFKIRDVKNPALS